MIISCEIKRIKTMADNSFDVTLSLPESAHKEVYELMKRKQAGGLILLEDISQEVVEQESDGWPTD